MENFPLLPFAHRFLVAFLIASLISMPLLALPVPPTTKTTGTKTTTRKAVSESVDNRPSRQTEHVLVKWRETGNVNLRQTILTNWSDENTAQRVDERTDSSFTLNDGAYVWEWTHANFDGLGRTTMVQKPDNTYLFLDYSVCGCAGGFVTAVFDERNNQKPPQRISSEG